MAVKLSGSRGVAPSVVPATGAGGSTALSTSRLRWSTYGGLFMVTMATLMYEILLTRIFSVTMWYHFAFVAISLALFGLTVGALLVHLFPRYFADDRVPDHLWKFSAAFAGSIAVCFTVQLFIPVEPTLTLKGISTIVLTCVVVSVPFVLSGVVVSLSLTRFGTRVNRLYAADLVGAALGCVVLVLLINRIDAPSVVIATGALAALGALSFAIHIPGLGAKLVAAGVVAILFGVAASNAFLHRQGDAFLNIRWVKGERDVAHTWEKWNSFSRITVGGNPNDPATNVLGMQIDSTAGTPLYRYDGDVSKVGFLKDEITNLGHYAHTGGDDLVVGVGGGKDVLSALVFGDRSVTGVEINNNILRATNGRFGNFTGHLDRDPRVRFVNDEARSYLTRTNRSYDMLQISLIDTFAATSSGAFALSENSLYTAQSWSTFFDRLKPDGILSISRWYDRPGTQSDKPLEMYRTVGLASQVLKDRGISNPRDHMVVYRGPPGLFGATVATLLVSPNPIAPAKLAVLDRQASRLKFAPILTPTTAHDRIFSDLVRPEGPAKGLAQVKADVSPPSDNKPFFFQMANRENLTNTKALKDRDVLIQPVIVLGLLAITVLGLAIGCIVLPLVLTTRRSEHAGGAPFYVYFASIGLAFLMVEVSLLQRFSIFLGAPIFGLTVVLFAMLLFSGIGSMLTGRLGSRGGRNGLAAPLAVLLAVALVFGLAAPHLLHGAAGATTPARIAVALALLAPLGLLMGMPFAIGMRVASTRPGAPTAFMWGINGAMSVCGSVFGLIIALFFGISVAFWTGVLAYLVAFLALVRVARGSTEPQLDPLPAPPEKTPVGASA